MYHILRYRTCIFVLVGLLVINSLFSFLNLNFSDRWSGCPVFATILSQNWKSWPPRCFRLGLNKNIFTQPSWWSRSILTRLQIFVLQFIQNFCLLISSISILTQHLLGTSSNLNFTWYILTSEKKTINTLFMIFKYRLPVLVESTELELEPSVFFRQK